MSVKQERMLDDRALRIAEEIIGYLDGLTLQEGCGILTAVLAAGINDAASDDTEATALCQAVSHDLRAAVQKGRKVVFRKGMIQ